jgi:chitodextrinase
MKKISGLSALMLSVVVNVLAQVDTTFIYNTSMPYGTLDLRIAKSPTRYYYLQEGTTFSFRETPEGAKTNTFRDMTASWNSSPYQQGNMREKNGSADQFVINYRILFPQNYNPEYDPGYPIIMMLHGAGETGNCWGNNCHWADPTWNPVTNNPAAPTDEFHELLNNDRNLFHGGLQHLNAVNAAGSKLPDDPTLSPKAFPGIVLFPQSLNGWSQPVKVEEAIRLLRLVIKKYNIDENRVYIHGLSNGGWGVNQALKRAPWLFASALTMSAVSDAEIPQQNQLGEVSKLPLWIFQGGQDTNPTPSKTFNWVKKLRDAGAVVRYYLYPSLGHGTWNTAYKEPDFFTWILGQRKYNPHVSYGNPVICNTTGAGVRIAFSRGFLAYQWEKDGVIISGQSKEELIANTPGVYRGRFSRRSAAPTESQWEIWSDPITVTEVNPSKPSIMIAGTTHLRGPGLTSSDANNTVALTTANDADLYDWYKNGQLINFQNTDIDDTLKTALITSGSSNSNGAYTVVIRQSYCPSPASDPVYLFFNNSAPQNITLNATTFGLKATANSSTAYLTWNDIIENELGYEIWRRKQGSAAFVFVAKTQRDAISFLDSGLQPASTYEYKIRTISKTGRSNYVPSDNLSTNFLVTTLGDTGDPLPPQNLTTTYNTVNSITIQWDAAQDDNGIKEYIITYGSSQATVPASALSYTIENLDPNTNYPITVQAVDYVGHVSEPSNQVIATTFVSGLYYKHSTGVWTDLDDPTIIATFENPEFNGWVANFTLTPRTQEDFYNFEFNGYLNLKETGKYLFRITSDDGSKLFIDDSVVVDNDGKHGNRRLTSDSLFLPAGLHTIRVQYFDYEGNQNLVVQYSGPGISDGQTFINIPDVALKSGEFTTPTPPSGPTNLVATGSGMHKVNMNWEASQETVEYYEVYRSEDGVSFSKISNSANTTFIDSIQLEPAQAYHYKVRAVNQNGTSGYSNTATANTDADQVPPTTPANVQVMSKSPSSIALSWTASTDNDVVASYEVYVNGILSGTSTTNSFTVTGLSSNVYNIVIKAIDGNGNTSVGSAEIQVDNTVPGLYYSLGEGDLINLTTWKKTSDGTGASPTNFSDPGQTFVIINRSAASVNAAWTISPDSKIVVSEGITFDVNSSCSCSIELKDNATLNLNHENIPLLKTVSQSATINFASASSIPAGSYGNIILTGSGTKTFLADSTLIYGNLTMNDNLTLTGPDNETTLVIGGNVVMNETATPVLKQDLHVLFTSNSLHTFQLTSDLALSKITVQENSTVKVNNSNLLTLTLGNPSGGGLRLQNGSLLDIGDINLNIVEDGSINPLNSTGRLAFDNKVISITTNTNTEMHLNTDTDHNTTQQLKLKLTGAGKLALEGIFRVAESVNIESGILRSNGHLKLLASSDRSAVITPIHDGMIEGTVSVEQYYPPAGLNVVRVIASPVQGVKVEKLQQIFPVTGSFQGASPGSADPSMFTSTGLWKTLKPFPAASSSNQEVLQAGKGYVTNLLTANDTSALYLTFSGALIQGGFAVPLLPGNGTLSQGWNLVGNPYVSNLRIDNDLLRSGLSNIVAIPETNVVNQTAVTHYKYFNLATQQPIIHTGQSFWIQAISESPSMTFNETNKTLDHDDSGTATWMRIRLNHADLSDETYMSFSESASDAYDGLVDAPKIENIGMFSLSTKLDDGLYAVNNLHKDACTKSLPLEITNVEQGEYTLVFSNVSTTGVHAIRLIDRFTGGQIELGDETAYNFQVTGELSSYSDRFELVVVPIAVPDPIVSIGDFCNGENAVINIVDNTGNRSFMIVNSNGETISELTSTAGTIELSIDRDKLGVGENVVSVVSTTDGCPGAVSIPFKLTYPDVVRLSTTSEVLTICSGSNAPLVVSSNEPADEFTWMNSQFEIIQKTNTPGYILQSPDENQTIYVAAQTSADCKSDTLAIQILVTPGPQPLVTLLGDTLTVNTPGTYEWYRNGLPYAETEEPYLILQDSGTYSVAVTTDVCLAGSNAIDFIPHVTAVNPEMKNELVFDIYPIPSDGKTLGIAFSQYSRSVQLEIVDMIGRKLYSDNISLDSESPRAIIQFNKPLISGVYLVLVNDGKHKVVKRFNVSY